MQQSCKQCDTAFEISQDDLAFLDKLSPTFGEKKYLIPPPTLCPDCRQQRRLFWRNERTLYRRACDRCAKSIIAIYPTGSAFPVYCSDCWWSDDWDPRDFGRPFDFSRPFFEQFRELQQAVSRLALNAVNNENAEYVNLSGSNKNCYLLFAAEYNEDCHYGYQVIKSQNCMDAVDCTESRFCYEVVDVDKCHAVSFAQNCTNCADSAFLFDCKGCTDCLLSTNLRNKRHVVRNRPCTKEEYAAAKRAVMDDIARGKLPDLLREFGEIKEQSIHRAREVVSSENATGDYLKDARNLRHCFDVSYGEDCALVYTGFQIKDLMDVCHTTDAELGYDSLSLGYGSYNALFTHGSWGSKNVFYCDIVQTCTDMFGCVCMKPGRHCILNKQYTQGEYEALVPKIIEQMQTTHEYGEFFPVFCAPFAYNETTAQQYFPLSKEEVLKRGWRWRDATDETPKTDRIVPAAELPDAIDEVPDDILNWAIECEGIKRPFKIVKQELDFYRTMKLPIPHLHPDERHRRRMALRNPRKLWDRECMKCGKAMVTSYAPARSEIVYCEECYLKEVY